MKYAFYCLHFDCNSVEVYVSFQTSFLVRLSWPEFEVGAVRRVKKMITGSPGTIL